LQQVCCSTLCQVLGATAEFEKASLVAKLKASRERKCATIGKCEGRKVWRQINPDLVREASDLAGERTSTFTREVATELAKLGFLNE
jgi:hypothetical protein